MAKFLVVWVLVGDAGRARIFSCVAGKLARLNRFALVESFDHAESRAHVRDLISDATGRQKGMGYAPGKNGMPKHRTGLDPRQVVKDDVALRFARDLVATLERGADNHRYDALVLIAPPHFLGMLKGELGNGCARRLRETVGKDYANLPDHAIREKLGELLAA